MSNERVGVIAVCPNCRVQLGIPAPVAQAAGLELECPRCATRFAASADVLQELPLAIVAAGAAVPQHDEHDTDDAVIGGLDFDIPGKPVSGDHNLAVTPAARPARRRSSPVGTLVGIVGGGAAGLLLAGYALLWITKPPLDLFRMREWLPQGMLPQPMRAADEDPALDQWDADWDEDADVEAETDEAVEETEAADEPQDAAGDAKSPEDAPPEQATLEEPPADDGDAANE